MLSIDGTCNEGYWNNGVYIDLANRKDEKRDVDPRLKNVIQKFLTKSQCDDYTCAICFDDIESSDFEIRKCGHIFHDSCWKEYKISRGINREATCPICRD